MSNSAIDAAATEFERRFHISVDESDNQSIQVNMHSILYRFFVFRVTHISNAMIKNYILLIALHETEYCISPCLFLSLSRLPN